MSFRVDGTSVVRATEDGQDVGVALAFDRNMAQRIADALNESSTTADLRSRRDPLTGEQVQTIDVRDRRPLGEVLGEGRYVRIVGPYATAEMNTPGGRQIRSLAEGAVLPSDVTAGTARHLLDVGLAQVVEAGSAREAYEGAPTERHRVEAAAMTGTGPTVGHAQPGTAAADYDRDPVAAARAAATPGTGVVTQLSGAGEAPIPEQLAGGEQSERSDTASDQTDHPASIQPAEQVARPANNASFDEWIRYAANHPDPNKRMTETQARKVGTRDKLRDLVG